MRLLEYSFVLPLKSGPPFYSNIYAPAEVLDLADNGVVYSMSLDDWDLIINIYLLY